MNYYKREQHLPVNIETAWDFFATPKNLNEVTPDELQFSILGDLPDTMYEGMLISYKIKPMLNISIHWVTEITHIKERQYFIDDGYSLLRYRQVIHRVDSGKTVRSQKSGRNI